MSKMLKAGSKKSTLPRLLISLFREDLDSDKWGSTLGYLFPLAEISRRHFGVTPSGYSPSMAEQGSNVPAEYGSDYITTELWDMLVSGEITGEDITYAFNVLSRYRDVLEAAGLDY